MSNARVSAAQANSQRRGILLYNQTLKQCGQNVFGKMVEEVSHRINSLLAFRTISTTTPRPPCAINGGSSTKYEKLCR
jgi:hypothetical protein